MPNPDRLVFIHIPKTAGLTLRRMLVNHYDLAHVCPEENIWVHVINEAPETLATYRLFSGHFPYSLGELFDTPPTYITMLRQPVEAVLSNFYHQLRNPNPDPADYKVKLPVPQTLEEFLDCPPPAGHLPNIQTRYIASHPLEMMYNHYQEVGKYLRGDRPDEPPHLPPFDVELAKERLNSCAMFGLTERFDESLMMLAYAFGWQPNSTYQSYNVANRPKKNTIAQETLEMIADLNALDIELYEYGTALFDQRFMEMCEDLLSRYGTAQHRMLRPPLPVDVLIELLNRHYEADFSAQHPERVDSIYYHAKREINGEGWHPAQRMERGGSARWTGPGTESSIDLPLKQGLDYRIQFQVLHAPAQDILDSVELWVNGHPVFLYRQPGLFWADVPKAAIQGDKPFVRLTFKVNRTIQPSDGDERYLGILLNWVSAHPI